MKGLWLFIHIIGFTAWLGGGLAVMLSGITVKYSPPEQRLAVYRAVGAIGRNLIVGAARIRARRLTVLVYPLHFRALQIVSSVRVGREHGLVGAIVAIGIVTPTAARLGRLELDPRGDLPESFGGLRRRQAIFATIAGVFALLALVSGTLFR